MEKRKLPPRPKMHKICIVCEGLEECEYLKSLNDLGVWKRQYQLILKNAKGSGNIPAVYQNCYQNSNFDVVLVFCDTEGSPYTVYKNIKCKINEIHGRTHAADAVIIFANPCTLQVIIKHWGDTKLISPNKENNVPFVEECTGVKYYRGKEDQIKKVMRKITTSNYENMCRLVSNLSKNYEDIGSSNFSVLIKWLESDDPGWIKEINKLL